jgi:hypothetical protein
MTLILRSHTKGRSKALANSKTANLVRTFPGTSCQATIALSLRHERRRRKRIQPRVEHSGTLGLSIVSYFPARAPARARPRARNPV